MKPWKQVKQEYKADVAAELKNNPERTHKSLAVEVGMTEAWVMSVAHQYNVRRYKVAKVPADD